MVLSAKITPCFGYRLTACPLDDDGDDDTDTDDESGQTYTAVSQTPTRITLTANSVIKKKTKNRIKSAVRLYCNRINFACYKTVGRFSGADLEGGHGAKAPPKQ